MNFQRFQALAPICEHRTPKMRPFATCKEIFRIQGQQLTLAIEKKILDAFNC